MEFRFIIDYLLKILFKCGLLLLESLVKCLDLSGRIGCSLESIILFMC